MSFCENCGTSLTASAQFCGHCGTALSKGGDSTARSGQCRMCGGRLEFRRQRFSLYAGILLVVLTLPLMVGIQGRNGLGGALYLLLAFTSLATGIFMLARPPHTYTCVECHTESQAPISDRSPATSAGEIRASAPAVR